MQSMQTREKMTTHTGTKTDNGIYVSRSSQSFLKSLNDTRQNSPETLVFCAEFPRVFGKQN